MEVCVNTLSRLCQDGLVTADRWWVGKLEKIWSFRQGRLKHIHYICEGELK